MSVSDAFRDYVLEQLGRITPVTARRMFGGVGIYADGLFFALLDDDVLYLKVDDETRSGYEAIGSGPFRPYGDDRAMQYYELPADVLEDLDALGGWVSDALAVARRARGRRRG